MARLSAVNSVTVLPSNWQIQGAGDFNGDGRPDAALLVHGTAPQMTLLMFPNRSDGSFGRPKKWWTGPLDLDVTQVLEEAIEGHREVKLFGGQEHEVARFRTEANLVRRHAMKQAAAAAISVPLVQMVAAVALALIRGFARHSAATVGNAWVDLTRMVLVVGTHGSGKTSLMRNLFFQIKELYG